MSPTGRRGGDPMSRSDLLMVLDHKHGLRKALCSPNVYPGQ